MTHVDGLGRVVKTVTNYGDGVPGTSGTDSDTDIASITTYDAAGRVMATQSMVPVGPITTFTYDSRDHLTSVTGNTIDASACTGVDYTGSPYTDCNSTTVFTYDRQAI